MAPALRSFRTLVPALCLVQLGFATVFADHFLLERTMIGGNAELYAFLRERLAVFDLPPDFYDAQYQNAAYDDAVDYLVGIAGAETREPFRFRVLYIWLVQGLTALLSDCETIRSGCGLQAAAFAAKLVNWGAILATFAVLVAAAPRVRRDSPVTLALAAVGTFSFGTLMTAPFVMADILSGLVFALAALFYLQHRFLALVATVCAGILVKEISIVLGVLIAAELLRADRRPLALILAGGALPLALFVAVRVALGGDPLSLNYGWDVSRGEFEIRYFFMHAKGLFVPFLTKVLFGVGVPLLLLLAALRNDAARPALLPFAGVCAALLVANLFLASMVVRVTAPLAPLLAAALIAHAGLLYERQPRRAI
ncbi:hypothetical protein GE300_08535 [Rhodobacteraceae bacterium 2CG4]|uniref:Dolichyl-phosphate-mannose-protein mannosyltransferase n=1 Tax=Halovulum marinum TaxID=2662447 RepID=A0A6L5YZG5_9RHOB|nr:hypothetical protein [Halovulum marinum]MSU89663.1 hypothetical protein [Halovulum marinum]